MVVVVMVMMKYYSYIHNILNHEHIQMDADMQIQMRSHTHTCTLGDIHLTHPHTSPASSLCIDMTAGLKRNAPALASVVAEAKVSSPKHNPDGQYPPLTPEAQIFTLRAWHESSALKVHSNYVRFYRAISYYFQTASASSAAFGIIGTCIFTALDVAVSHHFDLRLSS